MKKSILRIISLAIVAVMLFACTSCTQTILVRFVDAEGKDLNLGGAPVSASTEVPATQAPVTEAPTAAPQGEATTAAPVSDTPTEAPATQAPATQAPATQAPATEAPATQAPATEAPATQAPATEAPATQAPATQAPAGDAMPAGKDAIVDFYKAAVNKIKNDAAGGYEKKEWQVLDEINIGSSLVNNAVKGLAGNFMTTADKAEAQVSAKGSDEAKNRFPGFTLTDYSKVANATCAKKGNGNYDITIVLVDEDTPKKTGSMLGQCTSSVLFWEDIEDTLLNDATVSKILSGFENIHVIYKAYTIKCEITPDGKFVSMDQTAPIDILIGSAKIIGIPLKDKSGHLVNYCTYRNFTY